MKHTYEKKTREGSVTGAGKLLNRSIVQIDQSHQTFFSVCSFRFDIRSKYDGNGVRVEGVGITAPHFPAFPTTCGHFLTD